MDVWGRAGPAAPHTRGNDSKVEFPVGFDLEQPPANMVALPFEFAATARKARGAFFTPQPIATFLVDWAIRRPTETIFEPSCAAEGQLEDDGVWRNVLGIR